jgi:DNA-binding MurR/RpiR family transcriptional regulator
MSILYGAPRTIVCCGRRSSFLIAAVVAGALGAIGFALHVMDGAAKQTARHAV